MRRQYFWKYKTTIFANIDLQHFWKIYVLKYVAPHFWKLELLTSVANISEAYIF